MKKSMIEENNSYLELIEVRGDPPIEKEREKIVKKK
jgi:hypothetical protein